VCIFSSQCISLFEFQFYRRLRSRGDEDYSDSDARYFHDIFCSSVDDRFRFKTARRTIIRVLYFVDYSFYSPDSFIAHIDITLIILQRIWYINVLLYLLSTVFIQILQARCLDNFPSTIPVESRGVVSTRNR